MKRVVEVTTDELIKRNKALRNQYNSCLIKWYQVNMSKADRYRFGFMGYQEYIEWQQELAAEAAEKALEEELAIQEAAEKEMEQRLAEQKEKESSSYGHTFWEDDEGDRQNISDEEFAAFLAANSLDISTIASGGMDSLINN